MKRPLALLLAAALLFALCACGAQPDALTQPQTTEPTTAAPTSAVPTTRETTTEPAAEPTAAEPAAFSPDDVVMTKTPNSSCFSAVGYSEAFETLVVRFRSSGQRYCYFDVPASVWAAFRAADSLGRYYNTKIKGSYTCEKG